MGMLRNSSLLQGGLIKLVLCNEVFGMRTALIFTLPEKIMFSEKICTIKGTVNQAPAKSAKNFIKSIAIQSILWYNKMRYRCR